MIMPYRRDFRDTANYAAAVASELAAPLLARWARSKSRGDATEPAEWKSGLIVGHGHIGDVLYRTCTLDALATGLPQCRWSYLTTELGAEVLHGNSALHDILPWMTGVEPSSVDAAHAHALDQRKYDVVLCTESVRHQTALRLALRLGVPNRVAYAHKGLTGLMTRAVRLPHPMSRPAQFRAMVANVTGTPASTELRPRVYLSEADHRAAMGEWLRLGYTTQSRVLACSLTTRQTVGQPPLDFFIRVLRDVLEKDSDIRIALCGTLVDGQSLRQVADAVGPRASLSVGALPILAYAAFLQRCGAFFGADSGPRHLANAVGTPVFFVRNLATSAVEAGRYCESERDIAPDGEYLSDPEISALLSRVDGQQLVDHIINRTVVRV
jgi:ADP-heptose:LPS heptosyltransferase